MKVLSLTYYFPPEIGTGPHLPFELCESLVKLGHDVTTVTGFPRYNLDAMPPQYRGHFMHFEEMSGINVYRINAPNSHTKLRYLRGIVQQVVPSMLAIRAIFLKNKPDIVYTDTPPLLMGVAAHLVAKRFGIPCVVNVQDLFPQCALDLGLLHNKTLIRFLESMEHYIYQNSTFIIVMSEGNRKYVINKGGCPDRVQAIYNWVDADLIRPSQRMNDFRKVHGLGNKFVVLFAGTMGWSQGLETVVEAARHLANEPEILFLLVGGGVELEKLKKQAEGLRNVRFLPIQPRDVYPQVLAACDVALVTLRAEVTTPTVPSKISTIMAAGRPIIASIPPGDAPRIIAEANGGIVVPAGDASALAAAVRRLFENPEIAAKFGSDGRRFAELHLSRTACVARYESVFSQVIANARKASLGGENAPWKICSRNDAK